MKALRALRTLTSLSPKPHLVPRTHRFSAATTHYPDPTISDSDDPSTAVFDSTHYSVPRFSAAEPRRDPGLARKFRARADEALAGKKTRSEKPDERRRVLAKTLLEAALEEPDGGDAEVRAEDQWSLNVGIFGAPNAGKSALTNFMVGTKVAAVSRKTNTTIHEVMGILNKGNTQICFFDTPGLTLSSSGAPYRDLKVRVESAWGSINLFDVVIVIFDVHRHLTRPDSRVMGLIKRMGAKPLTTQKRVLCLNKVDLVEKKTDLLKVAKEFEDLPGFERYFMISGLKGSGVKDLKQYLMEQTIKRPWDEEPFDMTEEVMKNISLEVVRERLLDHIHQEIPYSIDHRLVYWMELPNGSIKIEHQLITPKLSQRKILIGKNGSKIGKIGMEANEELRSIFKRDVHLYIQVCAK